MKLFNWRRQAILNAMPIMTPGRMNTPWQTFLRRICRQPVAMSSGAFIVLLTIIALIAPWIVPYNAENYFDYDQLNAGPSLSHWFGVDSLGRDIFSRVLVGARISLAAGVFSVLIGAMIGTFFGLLAGYYEGLWDRVIMRVCDVLFAFPGILLAIAVVLLRVTRVVTVVLLRKPLLMVWRAWSEACVAWPDWMFTSVALTLNAPAACTLAAVAFKVWPAWRVALPPLVMSLPTSLVRLDLS